MATPRSSWRRVRVLVIGLSDGEGSRFRAWRDATQHTYFDQMEWTLEATAAGNVPEGIGHLAQNEPLDLLFIACDGSAKRMGLPDAQKLVAACVARGDRPGVLVAHECDGFAPLFREKGLVAETGATFIVDAVQRRTAELADKLNIS